MRIVGGYAGYEKIMSEYLQVFYLDGLYLFGAEGI